MSDKSARSASTRERTHSLTHSLPFSPPTHAIGGFLFFFSSTLSSSCQSIQLYILEVLIKIDLSPKCRAKLLLLQQLQKQTPIDPSISMRLMTTARKESSIPCLHGPMIELGR